jgi:UDP-N-acetylmuramate--alanine ligase
MKQLVHFQPARVFGNIGHASNMPESRADDAILAARSVHFIGIAGTGMQALAELMLARGIRVSGSDSRSSTVLERLNEAGARTFVGQAADQVGDAEGVIISAAVPSDNPEFQEARARGLPVATHAQVLGALSRRMRTIAVAGTHGKSTTTALTAHIATECGLDPVVLGGAYSPNLGGSGRAGRGDVLVVEADEFARRFLELTPTIAIITNIEADHLDFYGSFEAVEAAFADFAHRVAPDGSLLVCADVPMNPAIREDHRMQAYGESDEAIWRTSDYRAEKSGIRFLLQTPDGQRLPVASQLRGRHNALNATAAIAAACLIGVPAHAAVNAAASFVGTQRRFQTVLCNDGLWIVDDYAHHPTEIRATLAAARESHAGRIWAVFQPHTSHRTHALFDEFSMAFVEADEVLLLPIYHPTGREPETVEVTSAGLAEAMHHPRSRSIDSMENIVRLLRTEAQWGDLVLLMGAGDVTELGPRLAQGLGTSR